MSQDDHTRSTEMNAELPDEGMIHEWLDGQLDASTSARLDALVLSSPEFAARVAEARGLIAASSRILGALDSVPADVLPVAASVHTRAPLIAARRTTVAAQRKPVPWARWGSVAALLMIGVTGVFVANREPVSVREMSAPQVSEPSFRSAESLLADSAANGVANSVTTGAAASVSDASRVEAPRDVPAVAPLRAPQPAPAAPGVARSAAEQSAASDRTAAKSSEADVAVQGRARAAAVSPESLVSPIERTGGRVAADPAQRPSVSAITVAPAAPSPARRFAGNEATLGSAVATRSAARDAEETVVNSDIGAGDLVVAVQRVRCAPTCRQTRIELATDGRLRRWLQASGGSAPNDTAHVATTHVARIQQLIVSLDLASLPAMIRLQGSQCAAVGNLRESLRVEFSVHGTVRSSMGLPWCSDGTHALDRIAIAVEQLANEQFENSARR